MLRERKTSSGIIWKQYLRICLIKLRGIFLHGFTDKSLGKIKGKKYIDVIEERYLYFIRRIFQTEFIFL